ncbi:hypothetical protein V6D40_07225 [Corynebacterium sp. Q4381]|uniref:hypothetical protein n=1 Tax=Corynebacterium sp. Marseille-Q4381 TaxID=3121597 RepID=UPI002FE50FFE
MRRQQRPKRQQRQITEQRHGKQRQPSTRTSQLGSVSRSPIFYPAPPPQQRPKRQQRDPAMRQQRPLGSSRMRRQQRPKRQQRLTTEQRHGKQRPIR